MNNIIRIIATVFLLSLSAPAFALSGWVGATGLVSTENVYPQQGVELGIQENIGITQGLELRASASAQGQRTPEINYALADYSLDFGSNSIGARAGRLQLPYGYDNDLRVHPSSRRGIIPKPSIVWPQNKALYDQGDGGVFYLSSYFSKLWSFSGEWGEIVRDSPQPQKNYVQDLIGVESKQVKTSFQHLALSYQGWVFRVDEMQPTQTFNISERHWKEQIKVMPESFWVTGDKTADYKLSYRGIKYWGEAFSATFERSIFRYTGGGSLNDYYNAFRGAIGEMPTHERYHYNLGCEYYHSEVLKVFTDIGRTYGRDTQNIGENSIGVRYKEEHRVYKAQIIHAMTKRWSEWEYNGSWKNVVTPFNIYAISIIQEL